MNAALSFSPEPCDVLQNAHGNLPAVNSPVCTLVRHSDAPLSPQQHGGESVEKLRLSSGKTRVSRERLRTELTVIFRETVPGTAKEVARAVGDEVSAETIEAWRKAVPQAWGGFAAIGNAFPLFTLQSADLMGVDLDQDLRAFADFLSLQRRIRGQ